jgi:hypothetical protein
MINILASKNVIGGSEINVLHRLQDFWVVLSKDDYKDIINHIEDNFSIIEEESIYERLPFLKGKLDQPVNTTINVDYSTGEFNINPQHFHLGIPTHWAKATRQVNASFSFIRWGFTHRMTLIKFSLIELMFLYMARQWSWFFYIPLGLYFIYKMLSLFKTRDMFKSGNLCAAIVLNESNMKIAVLTDLTGGIGKFPIIRIKNVKLPGQYSKKGTMIPVAGGYQKTENYLHWNYFNPIPIPSGSYDDNLIAEKIKLIPTLEWVKLKTEINQFQAEPLEGYYPIDIENSSWKDAKLSDIKWVN